MPFDPTAARAHVEQVWAEAIIPALSRYITIPNLSPHFDRDWETAGHMREAADLLMGWAADRPISGLHVECHEVDGATPLLIARIPPFGNPTVDRRVLAYGHLDKQPPMAGWQDGLGPWTPVVRDGRLYGRGGADDGYSLFAILGALEALQAAGGAHGPVTVLIEASEESGSCDLPTHLEALGDALGTPDLVICLDSGALDFDRLWLTTSLRGVVRLDLEVEVLDEGVHSGSAGGVVPSSFAIARSLLDRVEDPLSGMLRVRETVCEIPEERRRQAFDTAAELRDGRGVHGLSFPYAADTRPLVADLGEQLLARTWRPSLEVVGADGLAPTLEAGNVLRPSTTLALSIRLPPTVDAGQAAEGIASTLEADPPHGAHVRATVRGAETGWDAPPTAAWLQRALTRGSEAGFGLSHRTMGEGGTIPFMGMLGRRFPDAQFVVTGVLGPGTNAHGPNEYLDIGFATSLCTAVAEMLDAITKS